MSHDMSKVIDLMSERLCHFYSEKMVVPLYKPDSQDAKEYITKSRSGILTFWSELNEETLDEIDIKVKSNF